MTIICFGLLNSSQIVRLDTIDNDETEVNVDDMDFFSKQINADKNLPRSLKETDPARRPPYNPPPRPPYPRPPNSASALFNNRFFALIFPIIFVGILINN